MRKSGFFPVKISIRHEMADTENIYCLVDPVPPVAAEYSNLLCYCCGSSFAEYQVELVDEHIHVDIIP